MSRMSLNAVRFTQHLFYNHCTDFVALQCGVLCPHNASFSIWSCGTEDHMFIQGPTKTLTSPWWFINNQYYTAVSPKQTYLSKTFCKGTNSQSNSQFLLLGLLVCSSARIMRSNQRGQRWAHSRHLLSYLFSPHCDHYFVCLDFFLVSEAKLYLSKY